MKKRRIDSLRERERQARAQMSSQGSNLQEAVPMFEPPVKVSPVATDRVAQEIHKKLGDFHSVKHLLDDPKSSIGVYGEPPSPAPGGPPRGSEFKKPNYSSSQNGRLYPRPPYHHNKFQEGLTLAMPRPPNNNKLYNGKTPPNVSDHGNVVMEKQIDHILKQMKSLPCTPLSAIAATPRKEETFTFPTIAPLQRPIEPIVSEEPKLSSIQSNNHLDHRAVVDPSSAGRKGIAQRVPDLEGDLRLTDSEDEARKRMPPHEVTKSTGASSSGSESTPSDSDSDSSSDDSKQNGNHTPPGSPAPEPEEPPEVVEGPGELPAVTHRSSWSLRNFAPQPSASPSRNNKSSPRINSRSSPTNNRISPRSGGKSRSNQTKSFNISSTAPGSNASTSSNTSSNNAESDSCSDSTKEVEIVLAETKRKATSLLSEISDSEDGSGGTQVASRPSVRELNSSTERNGLNNRSVNRLGARKSPRTPARPRPPSSPSASEDEAPPRPLRPDPEKRKQRGRPRKLRPGEEESVKRKRGRPPKPKTALPLPRPPPLSSDDEHSPPSPVAPSQWNRQYSDSEVESTIPTDKKKNDILGKLFCPVGGGKGGGKGGAKGGKGKGQVMIIEAYNTTDHDKEDDSAQRRFKEEEAAYKRQKEEDMRRIKEEEIIQQKLREEEALQRKRDEEAQKRLREEEIKRKKEEELKRLKEEANQRRLKEEEAAAAAAAAALQRKKEEEAAHRRKLQEEEALRRKLQQDEEALQKRLKEKESRRLKEEELIWQRKRKEEEAAANHYAAMQKRYRDEELFQQRKEDESFQRRLKEEALYRRYKEDDYSQRKMKDIEPSPRRIKEEDALQKRLREDEAAQRRCKVEELSDLGSLHNYEKPSVMVQIDLRRLGADCVSRLGRSTKPLKRPPPPPPAPPDKRQKLSKQNPDATPTNHERVEGSDHPRHIYYSYLERGHQDCASDEENQDHGRYLKEAIKLRSDAEHETEPLRRVMLYLESVLCFVLTGRVLELELDQKKAFTMYRETLEYIKSIQHVPNRFRSLPITKLDILSFLYHMYTVCSYRCQSLLYLRMFKMYKREVKDYNKQISDYQSKQPCLEAIGTVSPLSPTPSPAGSVGSVGSAGSTSSGYGSGAPTATPQHTPGSTPAAITNNTVTLPKPVYDAMDKLVKCYTYLHISHDLWDQADNLIRENRCSDLFINVDKVCGPLTMHSSTRHLVNYVRYAIILLKTQYKHNT